jgi:hypothetical protein
VVKELEKSKEQCAEKQQTIETLRDELATAGKVLLETEKQKAHFRDWVHER